MDYLNWVLSNYSHFCDWYAAGGDGPHNLWLFSGISVLLIILLFSYYLTRKLLGHRKFRGTWYNDQQWQALLKMTKEDQERGHRVMHRDEIRLLRKWELGRTEGFGRDSGWGL